MANMYLSPTQALDAAQRFNQGNALKRTIFELIAQELLPTLVPDNSAHGLAPVSMEPCVAHMHQ